MGDMKIPKLRRKKEASVESTAMGEPSFEVTGDGQPGGDLDSGGGGTPKRIKPARPTDDVDHAIGGRDDRGHHADREQTSFGAITSSERRRMIAEAAYFRAMGRGFVGGSPEEDWLEAEAEVVARLSHTS